MLSSKQCNGYGSIPEITNHAHETAIDVELTTLTPDEDPLRQSESTLLLLSKRFGFVFLGFLLGYGSANLPEWLRSAESVRSRNTQDLPIQQVHFPFQHHVSPLDRPFIDALPFEEIYPRQLWNPVQIPPMIEPTPQSHNATHHKHHHDPSIVKESSQSTFPYDYLKSIMSPTTSLLPTASSGSKAHTLYLANEAAFSLLYDNSNPKGYFLNEYSLDYFLLTSGGFDAQINQAYCAVASVAAMLNSLKYAKRFRDGDSWTFDLPIDGVYNPYPYATQTDILEGDCVKTTVTGHTAKNGTKVYGIFSPPYGLNLEQTTNLIKCHTSSTDWDVSHQEVNTNSISLSKMRYDLKAALIDPDARVLINYDRKVLQQVGGGHYSPVGAYHAPTDSFLVMDVAKYKYPPVWVGADTLFDAMGTVDRCGSWDFPGAQEELLGVDYSNEEEYNKALDVLGCKQRMRGYIVLKKKG
jgi:hypothetical protein